MNTPETAPDRRIKNNYFDGLPISRTHIIIFFIIMSSYFFEQLSNFNFGFIAPAMMQSGIGDVPRLTYEDIAAITFWYFIGMTAGGFMGGVVSDFIGRRRTFLLAIMLFSGASVLTGYTESLTVFIAARALTGFGVFCLMVCSQTYIAEMAPAESRGKWQGLIAAIGFCAVPVVVLICRLVVPLSPQAWRVVLYFCGAGFLGAIAGWKYLLESPRWLVSRNRPAEAEAVMRRMTGVNVDLSDAARQRPPTARVGDVLMGMFRRRYLRRTLVLLLVFVCTAPASFTVVVWTTNLFKMKGFSMDATLTGMTLISCGVPLGCYLAARIADMGGRKIPLMLTCAAAAACALGFGYMDGYVELIFMGALLNVFIMATFFILFSYTAESYPTRMRNTATGFHNGLARLAVAAFQPLIPFILNGFGVMGAFASVTVLMLLPIPVVLFWGERTSKRSLEDIN